MLALEFLKNAADISIILPLVVVVDGVGKSILNERFTNTNSLILNYLRIVLGFATAMTMKKYVVGDLGLIL